jgi:hypothetical protein
MRNSSVLTALFPQVRQGVLAATLGQPDKWWYLSELAGRLGTSRRAFSGSYHLCWQAEYWFASSGRYKGLFQGGDPVPIVPRPAAAVRKKCRAVSDLVEQILKPFGNKIQSAFICGSVARSREHAMSDVDVMVIGSAQVSLTCLRRSARRRIVSAERSTSPPIHQRSSGRKPNRATIFSPRCCEGGNSF